MNRIQSIRALFYLLLGPIVLLALLLSVNAEAATRFKLLKSLGNSGAPAGRLVRDSAGNIYGATTNGGSSNAGTVFKLKPSGKIKILHEFDGGSGGSGPKGIMLALDGNFYGTSDAGGSYGYGTVFKLDANGKFNVIHEFDRTHGEKPNGGLIQGSDGSFYGTTSAGGSSFNGTVFKLDPSGNFTMLHEFSSDYNYASYPQAGLIQASDGNFYGTTSSGGSHVAGTVFKLDSSGNFSIFFEFDGDQFGSENGGHPYGELIQASDGNIYGVTSIGGTSGVGTVYKFDLSGNFTTLADLPFYPNSGLIQGSDGNFYGTTNGIGLFKGTVFKLDPSGTLSLVHQFDGTDGANPSADLIQDADGNFYGTTIGGGSNGSGTVFKIDPAGNLNVLYAFDKIANAAFLNGLVKGPKGSLYGTSYLGGSYDFGTVFKFTRSGKASILYSFDGYTDGAFPNSALIQDNDGSFYGTTGGGYLDFYYSDFAHSTLFKIDPAGNFSTVYTFIDGASDFGDLIQANDGSFYGTASNLGSMGYGIVFKFDPSSNNVSVIHEFDGAGGGRIPDARLIQDKDGSLYGTTIYGGGNDAGTVFKIDPSGNFSIVHEFDGANGANPYAGLIQAKDGGFYGTTSSGGGNNAGTVFKLDSSGAFSMLHQFDGGSGGANPHAGLIQGKRGSFYGTTEAGGSYGYGTVFKLDKFGRFSVVHEFDQTDGANPDAEMIQARGGKIFGTTRTGGQYDGGVIFRLVDK